jgi:hypothetical protein
MPAAMYGVAVNGLDDASVRCLTNDIASTIRPKAKGRNLTVALGLSGVDALEEASCAVPVSVSLPKGVIDLNLAVKSNG